MRWMRKSSPAASSNASKERSGSFAELVHQAERMERAVKKMLAAHRSRDMASGDDDDTGLNVQRVKQLQREAARICDLLPLCISKPTYKV